MKVAAKHIGNGFFEVVDYNGSRRVYGPNAPKVEDWRSFQQMKDQISKAEASIRGAKKEMRFLKLVAKALKS